MEAGTYSVEQTLNLALDVIFDNGVTLIFNGGKITTRDEFIISLIGSHTRIIAPIYEIFGADVSLYRTWDVDYTYPQWFEPKSLTKEGEPDSTKSIQKALDLKGSGEVFLKVGVYYITSPIYVKRGTQLVGESAQARPNEEHTTIIRPACKNNKTKFEGEYLVYVNTSPNDDGINAEYFQYIDQSTMLKGIRFENTQKLESNTQEIEINKKYLKCVLAKGGVRFESVVWYNFVQAIKYTDTYNDLKSIVNCSFKCDEGYVVFEDKNQDEENDVSLYMVDMSGLGDALTFEHNAIQGTVTGKALCLKYCGGGSIQNNIINGDITINKCKGVSFNNNHCEYGVQVTISESCVTTCNNYMHRGSRPNYVIKSPKIITLDNEYNFERNVVTMQNDMFINLQKKKINEPTIDYIATAKSEFESRADYDIQIDENTILNIQNMYRYDMAGEHFDKMYPFGIYIKKNDGTALTEFNDYSYIASCKCQIQTGYKVNFHGTIKNVCYPSITSCVHNSNVCWLGENGAYDYYYQIIWDKARGIKKTSSNIFTSQDTFSLENTFFMEKGDSGLLLTLSDAYNGNSLVLRLVRKREDSNNNQIVEEVYVPLCGSKYIYDNGVCVSGYKWMNCTENINLLDAKFSKINMDMYRVKDGNVECFTRKPVEFEIVSGWKKGDIIYNIGETQSITIVKDDVL